MHAPPGHALVWKDYGPNDYGHHNYQAPAAKGTYNIMPAANYKPASGSMTFTGYSVVHWPTGKIIDGQRRLSSGVKTIEEAKAIAEADHERWQRRSPVEGPS
jgi:hypothetical protein